MSKKSINVPDLGGAAEVEVIEVCVAVGDTISQDQSLVVVESDKASMEIPSSDAGTVVAILVSEGDSVSEGQAILELEASETAAVESVTEEQVSAPEQTPVPEKEPEQAAASTAAQAEPAADSVQTVVVPDLGGAEEVELIELLVAVGDTVDEGDGLVVMESDKASMELPTTVAGVIETLHIKTGDQVTEGDKVADIRVQAGAATRPVAAMPDSPPVIEEAVQPTPATQQEPAAAVQTPEPGQEVEVTRAVDRRRKTDVYAGPAVRKLARELGVDLARVDGTGPRGRIAKEDLVAFVKKAVNQPQGFGPAIPAQPEIDFSQFGEIDTQPRTKLHKVTANNMHRSWLTVPHVTQFDEADITELEAFRASLKPDMERRGIKITPLPFLLKAAAAALRENPVFNASLSNDGESIIYKKYVHIGMAVDTPAGLMVPVIRDVDQKGIWELSAEINELAAKAKERKLKPAEMQGGCFTISSLGNIGGTGFTPIVNTPEVAILGVSRLSVKPVYVDGELQPRKMLPLSLSYDHRAVNGGDAGRFFTFFAQLLADMRRLVL